MPTVKFEATPGNPTGDHEGDNFDALSGKPLEIDEGTQRVIDQIKDGTGRNRDDIQEIFEQAAE